VKIGLKERAGRVTLVIPKSHRFMFGKYLFVGLKQVFIVVVASNRGGIQPLSLEKRVLILKLSINSHRGKNSALNDRFFNDS
jgi:hypothetical protein